MKTNGDFSAGCPQLYYMCCLAHHYWTFMLTINHFSAISNLHVVCSIACHYTIFLLTFNPFSAISDFSAALLYFYVNI